MLAALRSFFRGAGSKPELPLSRIGRLVYAIGDIHGRLDLFERMIEHVRMDEMAGAERPLIVLLGDYVDRGPDSAAVLSRILELQQEAWCDVEVLLGNHEESLLKFLYTAQHGPSWVDYGGGSTLGSYGVSLPVSRTDPAQWEETRKAFAEALPEAHLTLLRNMKYLLKADDYIFVHAGVHPEQPLEAQGPETFLWVRGAFMEAEKACDYVVVHGHTPEEEPADRRWRIGIDSGAYATGVLTAVRLKDVSRRIIQVRL
jgi:serine/threonine protein phosphatase 1